MNISNDASFRPLCQTLQMLTAEQIEYELELRKIKSKDYTEHELRQLAKSMREEVEPWKLRSTRIPSQELDICRLKIKQCEEWIQTNPQNASVGFANRILHYVYRLQRLGEVVHDPDSVTMSEIRVLMRIARKCYNDIMELAQELQNIQQRSQLTMRSPMGSARAIAHSTQFDLNATEHDDHSNQSPNHENGSEENQINAEPQSAVQNEENITGVTGSMNDTVIETVEENAIGQIPETETQGEFNATNIRNDYEFLQLSQSQYDPNISHFVRNIHGIQTQNTVPNQIGDGQVQTNPSRNNGVVSNHIHMVPQQNPTQLVYIDDMLASNVVSRVSSRHNVNETISEFGSQIPTQRVVNSGVDQLMQPHSRFTHPASTVSGTIPRTYYNMPRQNMQQQSRNGQSESINQANNENQFHQNELRSLEFHNNTRILENSPMEMLLNHTQSQNVHTHNGTSQNNIPRRSSNTSINLVNDPINQNRIVNHNQVNIHSNRHSIHDGSPLVNEVHQNWGGGNTHVQTDVIRNIPRASNLNLQNIPQHGPSQTTVIRNTQGFRSPVPQENVLYQEKHIAREQSRVVNHNQNPTNNYLSVYSLNNHVPHSNSRPNSRNANGTPQNDVNFSSGHYNSNNRHGFQNSFPYGNGNPQDEFYRSMTNYVQRMEQNASNRTYNNNNGKWSSQQYKILIENCQFWGDGPECDSKLGHYLANVEHFRSTQRIDERDLLNNITSTLKGSASKWYLTNLSQCTSLDRFKTLLRERFGAKRTKFQRITDLHGRKRKPTASVIQHIDEMIFDATAYELGLDEESLCEMIIQTLVETEQMPFKMSKVKTINQLKSVCRDFFSNTIEAQTKPSNINGNNSRNNYRSNQSNRNYGQNPGGYSRSTYEVENNAEDRGEEKDENCGQDTNDDQYFEDDIQEYHDDDGEVNEVHNLTGNFQKNDNNNRQSYSNNRNGQSFKSNGNYNRSNPNYKQEDRTNILNTFDLNTFKEFLVVGQKLMNQATRTNDSSIANKSPGTNNDKSNSRIYCYGCGKDNVTFWTCDTKTCLEQIQAKNLSKSLTKNALQTPKKE